MGYGCAIARFSQRLVADDRFDAPPEQVRAIFDDPERLAELTPLVAEITESGDRWRWKLVGITRLGITAAPAFTTVIDADDHGMAFSPDPTRSERATAAGRLTVRPDHGGTEVELDVTASVELPLPSMMGGAVRGAMRSTLKAGGARFADNLVAALGDPSRRGLRTTTADQ